MFSPSIFLFVLLTKSEFVLVNATEMESGGKRTGENNTYTGYNLLLATATVAPHLITSYLPQWKPEGLVGMSTN